VTILHGKLTAGVPNGNFFVPTDYFHYGSATAIGTPPIKLSVGVNPVVVLLADMNDDDLLDIVVGTFGANTVVDFITQGAKTQVAACGPADLNLPQPNSTPPVPSAQLVLNVVPAGETAFVFDPLLQQILYKTGKVVSFTAAVSQPVTSMAVGRLTSECPPDVGVTSPSPDNNIRLFKVK
jgi:hypothetical protein